MSDGYCPPADPEERAVFLAENRARYEAGRRRKGLPISPRREYLEEAADYLVINGLLQPPRPAS